MRSNGILYLNFKHYESSHGSAHSCSISFDIGQMAELFRRNFGLAQSTESARYVTYDSKKARLFQADSGWTPSISVLRHG